MRRLQPPPPAAARATMARESEQRGGPGRSQPCCVAQCSPLPPPLPWPTNCSPLAWNCIVLSTPFHPNTSCGMNARGYGFEETERLARDKRICFTATTRGARWWGNGEQGVKFE